MTKLEIRMDKFNYEFDTSNGILYKNYFGEITLNDIISSWDYAINNNKIPKETKGFIIDYRKASFNISEDEYIGIAKYYQNNLDTFRNFKIAIITENYDDIVVPVLVEKEDREYTSKPFSTVEAAIHWILFNP